MMGRTFRIKLRLRRFGRRHPWLTFSVRSFIIFSAAFGGVYGFITGSRSESPPTIPTTFAIGISFLFAIACVALATMSVRLRWLHQKLRKIAMHNEAMADRNWELQETEARTRRLFESQGDLIILRDTDGRITFVNDAYCELAQVPRDALIGSNATLAILEQGDACWNGTARASTTRRSRVPWGRAGSPGAKRWCEAMPDSPPKCRASAATSPIAPRASARWRGPRPGRCGEPRQIALPRDGEP
jgi:PAS domain S-box